MHDPTMQELQELQERWRSLWAQAGVSPDSGLFRKLIAAWSEPHRHYHTLQHLRECLANFETLRHLPKHPVEVGFAIWFHDAIYDVTRHDNEARSAAWAKAEILRAGLSEETADRVADLIMATRHNATPVGIDAAVLVDIDLWILGARRSASTSTSGRCVRNTGSCPTRSSGRGGSRYCSSSWRAPPSSARRNSWAPMSSRPAPTSRAPLPCSAELADDAEAPEAGTLRGGKAELRAGLKRTLALDQVSL